LCPSTPAPDPPTAGSSAPAGAAIACSRGWICRSGGVAGVDVLDPLVADVVLVGVGLTIERLQDVADVITEVDALEHPPREPRLDVVEDRHAVEAGVPAAPGELV